MEEVFKKAIGQRIRKQRELKKMTIRKCAELVGIGEVHLSGIERGIKAPSLETLMKIASVLEVSTDQLLQDRLLDNQYAINLLNEELEQLKKSELRIVQQTLDSLITVLIAERDNHEES